MFVSISVSPSTASLPLQKFCICIHSMYLRVFYFRCEFSPIRVLHLVEGQWLKYVYGLSTSMLM